MTILAISRTEGGRELDIADLKDLAALAPDPAKTKLPDEAVRTAILIREVEHIFLDLFAQGKMNGTVHTCVGQEFSAVAVAGQLAQEDWITSNHRCHGHFIAKTGNWAGLIDELMGLKSGVCKGIGSSQHLFAPGFLSNGPQAALVPVGTGIALHLKATRSSSISVSFIGEGTLGEGTLYEALNLSSVWQIPQLFVCENNLYSQSTPQAVGVSGTIRGRAEAFGIRYFEADTWNPLKLMEVAREAIDYVRVNKAPGFLTIRTYRLNAHSKGDDDREKNEVDFFSEYDPMNRLLQADSRWREVQSHIRAELAEHVANVPRAFLTADEYSHDQLPRGMSARQRDVANEKIRMVQALNRAYRTVLENGAYMIGEDIADPYGGAFKVTKGLGTDFGEHVLTSPISESGITGVGIGLALMGSKSYVEIMFGDFCTNIFDQLISNASKFHHMYGFQANVPLRIRTPMGGKRGYGPTHSQSLEKFLAGIDNVALFALTSLEDPAETIAAIDDLSCPAVIVESKVDYGRILWQGNEHYQTAKQGGALGSLILTPIRHRPTMTAIAYGETARELAESLETIFLEADVVIELVVPLTLHPFDVMPALKSARKTGRIVVIEDGSATFGVSAEIVARIVEITPGVACSRLGADPVPIPSLLQLEKSLLPSPAKLIRHLQTWAAVKTVNE